MNINGREAKSKRKRVVITDMLPREQKGYWEDQCPEELDLVFANESKLDLANLISDARALIVKKKPITRDLLRKARNLRLVHKFGHWPIGIDPKACDELGITVKSRPLMVCICVAEHTLALLLACARNLIRGHQETIKGRYRSLSLEPKLTNERDFSCSNWVGLNIEEVYGKTLGLVGFGEIAGEVAVRAQAFGMKTIYHDIEPLDEFWERELHVENKDYHQLLQVSDFISLHVPHTDATDKMIGREEFREMKESAYLINTCRGGVVDENALIEALQKKEITGAGLDVFVREPVPFDSPLLKMENVVLSPHTGGVPTKGLAGEAQETLNEVADALKGKISKNFISENR